MTNDTKTQMLEETQSLTESNRFLIHHCLLGLGDFAAELIKENGQSAKPQELRAFTETFAHYWGIDFNESPPYTHDYLNLFDDKILAAHNGEYTSPTPYECKQSTIRALHLYGKEMVTAQGECAITDIMEVGKLIHEISQRWDCSADISAYEFVRELENEVRLLRDINNCE